MRICKRNTYHENCLTQTCPTAPFAFGGVITVIYIELKAFAEKAKDAVGQVWVRQSHGMCFVYKFAWPLKLHSCLFRPRYIAMTASSSRSSSCLVRAADADKTNMPHHICLRLINQLPGNIHLPSVAVQGTSCRYAYH